MSRRQRKSKTTGRKSRRLSSFAALERKFATPLRTRIEKFTSNVGVQSSTAGGVVSNSIQVDPTVLTYPEMADMKGMYTSYRLLSAKLMLVRQSGDTSGRHVVVGSFLGTGISTPTTYTQVNDQARKLIWSPSVDTTGKGRSIPLPGNVRIGFQELQTTSTDVSGAPGGFYWYGDGFTASQPVFLYWVEVFFEFRNRS